jgi:hypothetical protein
MAKATIEIPGWDMKEVGKFLMTLGKAILFGLIAAALVFFIYQKVMDIKSEKEAPSVYGSDEYSIVFLNNNLFYFCKLEEFNQEFVECNDPYYLVRRNETAEDGTKEEKVFVTRPVDEEIYKPEGSIFIRKETIVYVAKVGDKSAVNEYIEKQK